MIKVIACKIYEYYISQLDLSLDNYEFVYLDIQIHNYQVISLVVKYNIRIFCKQ